MKADKMHRLTIPAVYLKRVSIKNQEKIQITKGASYGKFYIADEKQWENHKWKVFSRLECGNKLRLPKGIYSETAEYEIGIDKGGIFLIKSA